VNRSALQLSGVDPTPIFELFRGNYGTELLTAAVAHFNVFGRLVQGPLTLDELGRALELAERPALVLVTALRAMGLLATDMAGRLVLTPLAREHLVAGGPFDVGDYVSLAAGSPGVQEMVQRLRSNRPAGADEQGQGTAFIYRAGVRSAMEQEELARHFTLALSGRAKNVAPALAQRVSMQGARLLLDVGCGTGIYSFALLQRYSDLRVILLDRPEVLKIAAELAREYGVADRTEFRSGDMFGDDSFPSADAVLLSNVLHDWDIPECRELIGRCGRILPPGGRLLIHDVFLNDALDGPLPIALYSAALFTLTEGRAYSATEYRSWLVEAGLAPAEVVPTLIHCGVLAGTKP